MKTLLAVALGGALGSLARYLLSLAVASRVAVGLPWPTFVVNLLGCAGIGALSAWLEAREAFQPELRIFLLTGLLGGFTTFSTFAAEGAELLREGRTAVALGYASASVVLGIAAAFGARAGLASLLARM